MTSGDQADVAVVGAGIIGLSAAYALERRGASVTVYERGVPGNGQSGGDSRIFRHTHDDPRLIAFARRSLARWREWERESGRELVSRDGVVFLGSTARERHAALTAAGVCARLLDGAEVAAALPLLVTQEGSELLLDEDGGVIRTRTAIEMLRSAVADRIVYDEVMSVRPTPSGAVEVRRGDAAAEHDQVLVCAGIGTAGLAHGTGVELPVRNSLHVRLTFALRAAAPARLACLLDAGGASGETHAYGDPLPGNGSYAVGVTEAAIHPDGGLIDPDGLALAARRTVAYANLMLPGVLPTPSQARHCWVTELEWGTDGFAVWSADGAHFLSGQNLFKHAPAIGEALAATALTQPTEIDLSPHARLGAATLVRAR
jgi:sarcosine oxidase